MGDSDSEDDSEDDEDEENNRSVVLDNDDHSSSSEEAKGSSDSVTEARHDVISSDSGAPGSVSEEEKSFVEGSRELDETRNSYKEVASVTESHLVVSDEQSFQQRDNLSLQTSVVGTGTNREEKEASNPTNCSNVGERVVQATDLSNLNMEGATVVRSRDSNGVMTGAVKTLDLVKPLNFDEINSAAELEVVCLVQLY